MLGQVYRWFDRLKAFQAAAGEDMRQGSLETRLVVAGHGDHQAGAGEQAEIQSFGATLFSELAARREPPVPGTAPARLLLPTRLVPPKENDEIVLQLPDHPPAPPPGMGTAPTPRPQPAVTPEESPPS